MTIPDLFARPTVSVRAQGAYLSMVVALDEHASDLRQAGKALGAAKVRHYATIAHSAWRAEDDDPEPTDVPWCHCGECWKYLTRVEVERG